MAKVISIINHKGGVGKSTTAQALASGLKKALIIDTDMQGNTSFTYGADTSGKTILGVLLGEVDPEEAIQKTSYGDIIASSPKLAGADTFITETGKEYKLKEAIEPLKEKYDYIIIDTPPSLGILTVNALVCSDSVIIPALAELYSLQGIGALAGTLEPIKKYCNPALKIDGILLTQFSTRSAFNQEVRAMAEDMAKQLGTKVFKTTIRSALAIRKAQANQVSIFKYDAKGNVTADYRAFIKEWKGAK